MFFDVFFIRDEFYESVILNNYLIMAYRRLFNLSLIIYLDGDLL